MMRSLTGWAVALACAALVAGCADEGVPGAGFYSREHAAETVPLAFVSGTARLTPRSAATLRDLRRALPGSSAVSLAVAGGLDAERAQSVGLAIGREVAVRPAAPGQARDGTDPAILEIDTTLLLPTECLDAGQPTARGNWPGDDDLRFRMLPPGCATANALQQMVVDKDDLVRGRTLAPGAALPVARAIERYWARDDRDDASGPGRSRSAAGQGSGVGAGLAGAPVSAVPPGASTDGSDLLQGPLAGAGPGATARPGAAASGAASSSIPP